jgi:hydroxymethylpyrimidine/phosphomethylpyrimidine kinase
MNHKVLSIAGFDGSGGAGIQADLKTFAAFGCYGMTVLTALPVQNTTGVKACYALPIQAIQDQLQVIFEDITPDAIKIGMLFNAEVIEVVADFLSQYASHIPIVLDPVMYAKSGDALLLPEALEALKSKLIPLSTIMTPNLPEASMLTGLLAPDQKEMVLMAEQLLALGSKAIFLKGGHLLGTTACDFYLDQEGANAWLTMPKIQTKNTHGTGCTLSAAMAACLSRGMNLLESCKTAKDYLYHALQAGSVQNIGKGNGPVDHLYCVSSYFHSFQK